MAEKKKNKEGCRDLQRVHAEERAAMRERAKELKASGGRESDERAVIARIAEMPEPDRTMGERLHAIIKKSVRADGVDACRRRKNQRARQKSGQLKRLPIARRVQRDTYLNIRGHNVHQHGPKHRVNSLDALGKPAAFISGRCDSRLGRTVFA